jgi:hypothetical protein
MRRRLQHLSLILSLGCPVLAAPTSPEDLLPFVFPSPREATYGEPMPIEGWQYTARGLSEPLRKTLKEVCGPSISTGLDLVLKIDSGIPHPQGYALQVNERACRIQARTEEGLYYGLRSLGQLQFTSSENNLEQSGKLSVETLSNTPGQRRVRAAQIRDWPGFELRGLITDQDAMAWLTPFKFNVLQHPGFRGDLDSERRKRYQEAIRFCEEHFIRFIVQEGYRGWFGGFEMTFDESGYQRVADYYRERFDLGTRYFTVCFDDEKLPAGAGKDWGTKHARTCMEIRQAMLKLDPSCQFIFCPLPYCGIPDHFLYNSTLQDGQAYLRAVADALPPDVQVFWTGDNVFSQTMERRNANRFGEFIGRNPFVWDNDPLQWGRDFQPLQGRSGDLHLHSSGYVGNIADRSLYIPSLPLVLPTVMTMADYLWNPEGYEPQTSLRKAFRYLAGERASSLQQAWQTAGAFRKHRSADVPADQVEIWLNELHGLRDSSFERALRRALMELWKYRCGEPSRKVLSHLMDRTKEQSPLPDAEAARIASIYLEHPDPTVQIAAVEGLSQLRAIPYAPQIAEKLTSLDANVRAAAAKALGQLKTQESARPVAGLLNDPHPKVRIAALNALGQLKDPSVLKEASPLLKSENTEIKRAALSLFGELADASSAPLVAPLLEDPDPLIRGSAAIALGRLVKGSWPTNSLLNPEAVEAARKWWADHRDD